MSAFEGPNIIKDGLVLHLDAANTKSYPGSGTDWYDLSGGGNHGTLNGAIYDSSNKGNIVFDGNNDFIILDNISSSLQTSGPLTLCAWIYKNVDNNGMIFSTGGYYGLFTSGSYWYWNNNPNWVNYYCPVTVPSNVWIYYCLTFNSSTNPIFYINGESYTSTGTYDQPSPFGSTVMYIGEYSVYRPYSAFNGNIGVLSFYNRVLSPSEIQKNFTALRKRYDI